MRLAARRQVRQRARRDEAGEVGRELDLVDALVGREAPHLATGERHAAQVHVVGPGGVVVRREVHHARLQVDIEDVEDGPRTRRELPRAGARHVVQVQVVPPVALRLPQETRAVAQQRASGPAPQHLVLDTHVGIAALVVDDRGFAGACIGVVERGLAHVARIEHEAQGASAGVPAEKEQELVLGGHVDADRLALQDVDHVRFDDRKRVARARDAHLFDLVVALEQVRARLDGHAPLVEAGGEQTEAVGRPRVRRPRHDRSAGGHAHAQRLDVPAAVLAAVLRQHLDATVLGVVQGEIEAAQADQPAAVGRRHLGHRERLRVVRRAREQARRGERGRAAPEDLLHLVRAGLRRDRVVVRVEDVALAFEGERRLRAGDLDGVERQSRIRQRAFQACRQRVANAGHVEQVADLARRDVQHLERELVGLAVDEPEASAGQPVRRDASAAHQRSEVQERVEGRRPRAAARLFKRHLILR